MRVHWNVDIYCVCPVRLQVTITPNFNPFVASAHCGILVNSTPSGPHIWEKIRLGWSFQISLIKMLKGARKRSHKQLLLNMWTDAQPSFILKKCAWTWESPEAAQEAQGILEVGRNFPLRLDWQSWIACPSTPCPVRQPISVKETVICSVCSAVSHVWCFVTLWTVDQYPKISTLLIVSFL